MTPAELFDLAGRALFGDHYVAPLAHDLGVDKNTVGKWRAGKSPIPPGVFGGLLARLEYRKTEIGLATQAIADHFGFGPKERPPARKKAAHRLG